MSSPDIKLSLPETIEVHELPEGVQYTLPLRPLGWWRFVILLLSPVAGLAAALLTAFVAFQAVVFARFGVGHFFGKQAQAWPDEVFYLVPAFIGLIAGLDVIGFGIWFTLCQSEIEIGKGKIVARQRLGPFRRSRRVPRELVEHLTITIPPTRRRGRRLHEHLGDLVAMGEGLKTFHLVGDFPFVGSVVRNYPVAWLVPLAEDLTRRWHAGATDDPPPSRRPSVTVLWTHGIEDLDLTQLVNQPPESRVRVAFHADGITLRVPALGVQRGAGRLFVFTVFWCVFTLVVTVGILFLELRHGDELTWGALAILGFLGVFWLAGAVLLATATRAVTNRAVFRVSNDRLSVTQISACGRTRHEWNRDEIALIGVGPTPIVEDTDGAEVMPDLSIYPKDASHVSLLEGRDLDELRWIATTLRWVLQLPAEPAQEIGSSNSR